MGRAVPDVLLLVGVAPGVNAVRARWVRGGGMAGWVGMGRSFGGVMAVTRRSAATASFSEPRSKRRRAVATQTVTFKRKWDGMLVNCWIIHPDDVTEKLIFTNNFASSSLDDQTAYTLVWYASGEVGSS